MVVKLYEIKVLSSKNGWLRSSKIGVEQTKVGTKTNDKNGGVWPFDLQEYPTNLANDRSQNGSWNILGSTQNILLYKNSMLVKRCMFR